MLSKEQVIWLTQNFQYLNISLDGMKEIQDIHRPTRDHKNSYETVINTIGTLNDAGLSFSFIHLGLVRFTSNHYLHVEDVEPLPN